MVQLQVYIPYILNNITHSIIRYYFRNENIGDVVKANMHNKINNGQSYFVAIMIINLYDTNKAREFYTRLQLDGGYRFVYDEEAGYSWYIKLYNEANLQKTKDDIMPITNKNIPLNMVTSPYYNRNEHSPVNFSGKFQDYLYDAISLENILREINVTIRNYTYELYGV